MTTTLDTPTHTLQTTESIFNAHTAYTFNTDIPITDEQIEAIYTLMQYAPTAYNTQPLRLINVKSPEARAQLVDHMSDGNKAKTASAPATLIVAADTNFHDHLPHTFPVFPGARDIFLDDTMREQVAQNMTWLQLGYLILAIRATGLDAGPMTGFDAQAIDNSLLADTGYKTIAVVNIGHPGENAHTPRNPRLTPNETITTL